MEIQFVYKVVSHYFGETVLEPVIFFDMAKAIEYAQKLEDEGRVDDNFDRCIIFKEKPSMDEGYFRTVGTVSFIRKEDLK